MTRKQFLNALRSKLQGLDEKNIDNIIKEYEEIINQRVKSGKKVKEAIEEFGDIDSLVEEILSIYNNSSKKTNKQPKIDYYIDLLVDKIITFFHEFSNLLATNKGEDIIRIVFKVFVILFFIWLLKIPFCLLEIIGKIMLRKFPLRFYGFICDIWHLFINFGYLIFAVVLLYILLKRLIYDKNSIKSAKKSEDCSISSIDDNQNYASMMFKPFLSLVKFIGIIFTLPIWLLMLALIIILGIMFSLLLQGIYLLSAFFIVLGLLIFCCSILALINYFIFNREEKER